VLIKTYFVPYFFFLLETVNEQSPLLLVLIHTPNCCTTLFRTSHTAQCHVVNLPHLILCYSTRLTQKWWVCDHTASMWSSGQGNNRPAHVTGYRTNVNVICTRIPVYYTVAWGGTSVLSLRTWQAGYTIRNVIIHNDVINMRINYQPCRLLCLASSYRTTKSTSTLPCNSAHLLQLGSYISGYSRCSRKYISGYNLTVAFVSGLPGLVLS